LHKAVETFREALKLEPGLAEGHLNLAYAYQRLKRLKDAEREYEAACSAQPKFCRFVPKLK